MTINESITKASQGVWFVVSDLEAALQQLNALPLPPEGRTMANRAAVAYVASCLDAARKLQSDLAKISD